MTQATPAVLEEDRNCVHCGYNLRGLVRDGKCPECFTPIVESLRGSLLRHADPEWLERLRFGCALKLWNIVIGITLGMVAGALVAIGLSPVLLHFVSVVGGLLGIWAAFVITTQEPRISLQEDPITWRKVIRWCAVAAAVGNALQDGATGATAGVALGLSGSVLGLAGVVSLFGELIYFERFALRVPDTKLARSTKIVRWGGATTLAVGLFASLLAGFFGPLGGGAVGGPGASVSAGAPPAGGGPSPGSFGGVFMGALCVMGVAVVVFGIWYLLLLVRFRRMFVAAAAAARHPNHAPESNPSS